MSPTDVGTWLPVEPPADIETLVGTEPEIVALAGIATLIAAIVAWYGYRWLTRPPAVSLKRVLGDHDTVNILTHPNPDPDAMACALGIAHIANWVGADPTIYFSGQIRHQENRAFRTVLDLEMEPIESWAELPEGCIVLVDHNSPRGFEGAEQVTPDIVIDHHIGDGQGKSFTDVRSEYGAAASIISEYFRDLKAKRLPPEQTVPANSESLYLDSIVATALLFGIQSDTDHLTSGCTDAEFEASAYLFPSIDEEKLDRIANPPVTKEVLEIKAAAIENFEQNGSFGIADVGTVSDVDAIPQAADEIICLEGITAVIVVGEREGTLHISGRSRDDRVHMGRALETAVAEIPTASAGGHARMGGGQIPVDHLEGIGPSGAVTKAELNDRIIKCLNGNI